MKRLLLAAAAALAFATPALSKDIVPQQFRGNWCGLMDSDDGFVRTPKPCHSDEADSLTVKADETYYNANDGTTFGHCKVLMTDPYKPGRPEYIVRLKCGDETELYWMYLSRGKLFHNKFKGGGYR